MNAPCKLLIADDECWVREDLLNLLDWRKLAISPVEPAVDGEDAIRRLEAERPDILITDINMPFLGGTELIREAKKRFPGLQIIVLSGYSDFAFVREALLGGAIDYLLKPVAKDALLDVIGKALSLLASSREEEKEQAEQNERLLEAASIIRDGELSVLIAEDAPDRDAVGSTASLELEFAIFTLVLVRLTNRPGTPHRTSTEASRLAYKVKNLLAPKERGDRAVAFNNVYARNEFILLTDMDDAGMSRLLRELPERLARQTGTRVALATSRAYYSFDKLRTAYHEARTALGTLSLGREGGATTFEDATKVAIRKRITAEDENSLIFALQSGNKQLAREIIFDRIGIQSCVRNGWLLVEAKQTVEYLTGMIFHHAVPDGTPHSPLAMENIGEFLEIALESENNPEVSGIVEQLLDEVFGESEGTGVSDTMRDTVKRVEAYVAEHYFEELSLTMLSTAFKVERGYLSKAFKQVTGCNLMLAIANRRIEKATEYIRGRDLSLSEISYLVGYDDYAYFNRVFRKITGMSPSDYKAAVHKEKK